MQRTILITALFGFTACDFDPVAPIDGEAGDVYDVVEVAPETQADAGTLEFFTLWNQPSVTGGVVLDYDGDQGLAVMRGGGVGPATPTRTMTCSINVEAGAADDPEEETGDDETLNPGDGENAVIISDDAVRVVPIPQDLGAITDSLGGETFSVAGALDAGLYAGSLVTLSREAGDCLLQREGEGAVALGSCDGGALAIDPDTGRAWVALGDRVVTERGGAVHTFFDQPASEVVAFGGVAWLTDGGALTAVDADGVLWQRGLGGEILALGGLSAHGAVLAVIGGDLTDDRRGLVALDAATGDAIGGFDTSAEIDGIATSGDGGTIALTTGGEAMFYEVVVY